MLDCWLLTVVHRLPSPLYFASCVFVSRVPCLVCLCSECVGCCTAIAEMENGVDACVAVDFVSVSVALPIVPCFCPSHFAIAAASCGVRVEPPL